MKHPEIGDKSIEWTKSFKILGIEYTTCLSQGDENYKKPIEEIQSMIEEWNKKLCTTIGKANIAKSLLLSKLTHYSISLPSPNWKMIHEIQKMINKFIWGKHEPIGLEQAKLSYERGE